MPITQKKTSCYYGGMKSETHSSLESRVKSSPVEMIEGPEAAERFTRLVRGIMNVPGADVRKQIEREHKARVKKNKKRAKTSPASRASSDH
jgi:hypothetical protein